MPHFVIEVPDDPGTVELTRELMQWAVVEARRWRDNCPLDSDLRKQSVAAGYGFVLATRQVDEYLRHLREDTVDA